MSDILSTQEIDALRGAFNENNEGDKDKVTEESKTVLLVDDAAFMRMMLKDILTKNGYAVVGEAENGDRAIEKFKELSPDIVILDIVMPEKDGIDALREINKDGKSNVIMCSAMGKYSYITKTLINGAKDFIVKPFYPDRSIQGVETALKNEGAFDRLKLDKINREHSNEDEILSQGEIDNIMNETMIMQNENDNQMNIKSILSNILVLLQKSVDIQEKLLKQLND